MPTPTPTTTATTTMAACSGLCVFFRRHKSRMRNFLTPHGGNSNQLSEASARRGVPAAGLRLDGATSPPPFSTSSHVALRFADDVATSIVPPTDPTAHHPPNTLYSLYSSSILLLRLPLLLFFFFFFFLLFPLYLLFPSFALFFAVPLILR